MITKLTKDPKVAADFIKQGGVVAFPTETVYGLGADVFNPDAIEKIFDAKRRPSDNPLIAHISSLEQVQLLASKVTPDAARLIDAFFPGPLTVVLPKAAEVPLIATAGLQTIGIRMPRYELAREFLIHCGMPVVAPSANLSGRPSPTTWQAVAEDLNGRIDCILQGDATEIGLESTVVDCSSNGGPVILRSGSVTIDEIRRIVPNARYAVTDDAVEAKSPGMKHQHYSPRARVVVIDRDDELSTETRSAYIGVDRPVVDFTYQLIVPDVEAYAGALFEFFRECDRRGIELIYCEGVEDVGIGTALMDRIDRAAAG